MTEHTTQACQHDWQRAPDRDVMKGGCFTGIAYEAELFFWCKKCLAVETRIVKAELR